MKRRHLLTVALLPLAFACATANAPKPEAPPQAVAAPTPPQLRLPDTVRPSAYQLQLAVNPDQKDFSGEVKIDLQLDAATSVIWLHAEELQVSDATLLFEGQSLPATVLPPSETFLGLQLPRAVGPGKAQLSMHFRGAQEEKGALGIFRQNEGGAWYSFSQFEAEDARKAFPCFDEPRFKVPLTLTLTVPEGMRAFANMPEVGASSGPTPGQRTIRFQTTPPLPTYLIALAVGPFEVVEAGRGGKNQVPIRIITTKGRASWAAYAAKDSVGQLDPLEAYFGIPYPYPKLDLMEIPLTETFGAMENPGLVTFVSNLLLSAPERDTPRRQRLFTTVAAHELAHQWFGDLVTPAWWDDIWLNEAFASWMEAKGVGARFPSWNVELDRAEDSTEAMAADSLLSARQIRQPIKSRGDIQNAFDGITYQKGSSVLALFEHQMGEEAFRNGVRRYFQEHAQGVATSKDFLQALSSIAGQQDLGKNMATFLDQPGLPLVSFQLACTAGAPAKLLLQQTRYLPLGPPDPEAKKVWNVPVCVRWGSGKQRGNACTVLAAESGEMALPKEAGCPEWVVPNDQAVGYYRSHLQGSLSKSLAKVARKELSTREQIGLIDDSYAAMRAGSLPAEDALQIIAGLMPTEERGVVKKEAEALADLRWDYIPEKSRENHARMVRKTFGPLAKKIGFTPRPTDSEEVRVLRPDLLKAVVLQGKDPALRKEAKQLAEKWISDPKSVSPDVIGVALISAAEEGDAAFNQKLKKVLETTTDRNFRRRILAALGSVQKEELVRENLGLVVDPKVDAREGLEILKAMWSEPATREKGYRFLLDNYDAITSRIQDQLTVRLVVFVGEAFCDGQHRQEGESFFGPRTGKLPGGPRRLAQALEKMDRCIAVKEAQQKSVGAFLQRY